MQAGVGDDSGLLIASEDAGPAASRPHRPTLILVPDGKAAVACLPAPATAA